MKKCALMLIVAAGLMLALPGSGMAEPTRTVEWYLAPENSKALDDKVKECQNNPGELGNTPNCVNARAAFEKRLLGGSFKPVKEPAIPKF